MNLQLFFDCQDFHILLKWKACHPLLPSVWRMGSKREDAIRLSDGVAYGVDGWRPLPIRRTGGHPGRGGGGGLPGSHYKGGVVGQEERRADVRLE